MQTTAKTKKIKKLPPAAGWLIGYACVLAAATGLAYFWRIAFEQGQLAMLPLFGGIALVFSVLYLALFLICRFAKQNICLKAAACVFILGLLFCFANPPLQAPDETAHFLRANAISMGRFNYDATRTYPNDVSLLMESFPSFYNHGVKFSAYPLVNESFAKYQTAIESGAKAAAVTTEPVSFMLWPFFVPAGGMAVARLFGFGALGQLYAGRIANLILYTFLCYLVFKNCSKYRGVFIAVAMLPLSLFMAASCSYDSVMLALCFLAVSYFCKEEIYSRDIVVFGIAILLATYLKQMNIVLAAVLLLIPKARWRTKWNPWIAAGIIIAVSLLFRQGMALLDGGVLKQNYPPLAELDRGLGDANPSAQLSGVIANPFRFVSVAVLTLMEQAGFLFGLGTFGWLDLSIPLISGLSVLTLCTASALGIQQKDDTKNGGAAALFLAALLYAGAVMLGIYLYDSGLYSIRITGLQPRYFLPVFLLLFMLASILLGKAVRPRLGSGNTALRTESLTLWIAAAVALLGAILLIQYNFIGQWVEKSEGFKLVNVFGWVIT